LAFPRYCSSETFSPHTEGRLKRGAGSPTEGTTAWGIVGDCDAGLAVGPAGGLADGASVASGDGETAGTAMLVRLYTSKTAALTAIIARGISAFLGVTSVHPYRFARYDSTEFVDWQG